MRVLLSKFCEYGCKLENGRHTMVGIFDDIRVREVPFDHPPFFLCIQIQFEPSETGRDMNLETVLLDEDGKEIFSSVIQGPIPKEPGNQPVKLFLQIGLPPTRFESAGQYRLDVLFNGAKVGDEVLPVFVIQEPEPYDGPSPQ
jgi:hypothetical protein